MKSILLRGSLLLAALAAGGPKPADAQVVPAAFNNGCQVCVRQYCVCTTAAPVVETRYKQEPVVTWRDVHRTEYRQEGHVETVPVTSYQQVTVDEGGYQMVWVPKPVTKQVARTDYQQRLNYRLVPYHKTQRIPEFSTRLVAEQTVRYIPQQMHSLFHSPGCVTCPPVSFGSWPATTPPPPSSFPVSLPALPTASYEPVPDPNFTGSAANEFDLQRLTAPPPNGLRSSATGEVPGAPQLVDEVDGPELAPFGATPASKPSPAAGRFVPAPSAATVWQTRRHGSSP